VDVEVRCCVVGGEGGSMADDRGGTGQCCWGGGRLCKRVGCALDDAKRAS
jgi:hypothetical protein